MIQKLKVCAYCGKERKIFKNTINGPQCVGCYKYNYKYNYKNNTTNKYKPYNKRKSGNKRMALIEKLDNTFSLLVRVMNSIRRDDGGHLIQCYTCEKWGKFSEMQCGHYIPRQHIGTRFLLDNCRPQCIECNVEKRGNIEVFKKKLELDAPGIIDKLERIKKSVVKYSDSELEEMLINIKEELKHQHY